MTALPVTALRFDGFSYTHPGRDEPALRDVSLTAEPGEFVLVCGLSGSGKSTLLKAISGIVPHHYGGSACGEVEICGRDLREHDAASLAAVCGTVLQDPESQAVMGGVEAELAFPLENAGWPAARIARGVEETALALGIERLLGARTAELSGGELQRSVLAASLVLQPELIVLDEPTSQLDPVAADELVGLLRRLNRDHGCTVVVADHRVERILEHADRVLVIEQGRLAFDGTPAAMLAWSAANGHRHLLPPVARAFELAGIEPLPVSLHQARSALVRIGFTQQSPRPDPPPSQASTLNAEPALRVAGVDFTYEHATSPVLDDVSLSAARGDRIALMGANGAGKSTLLRLLKGLAEPARGTIERAGEVGLLMQNPNDYLLHERVADEAPAEALARFGLSALAEYDPRDLSGGERQRLALAIVMQGEPAALLLDEPSRGMDRLRREQLIAELREIAARGTAVIVATHDAELAAEFAQRVVLLGRGRVLADAPVAEVLADGPYFATDVARLLPGSGALTARQGGRVLAATSGVRA